MAHVWVCGTWLLISNNECARDCSKTRRSWISRCFRLGSVFFVAVDAPFQASRTPDPQNGNTLATLLEGDGEGFGPWFSSDDPAHDLAVDVGEAEVAPCVSVGEPLVVIAQQTQKGGMEIMC